MNNQNKEEFKLVVDGDLFIATGDGWRYVGHPRKKIFTQDKKLPSIRVIKTLVKELLCLK